MKISTKSLLINIIIVVLIAAVGFCVHLFVLQTTGKELWAHKIVSSYVVNVLLAEIILVAAFKAPEKFTTSLGFLFLAGSAIKFAVFFIFFMPGYKADGILQKLEFFTFFIPYILCLIVETTLLVRHLNRHG